MSEKFTAFLSGTEMEAAGSFLRDFYVSTDLHSIAYHTTTISPST